MPTSEYWLQIAACGNDQIVNNLYPNCFLPLHLRMQRIGRNPKLQQTTERIEIRAMVPAVIRCWQMTEDEDNGADATLGKRQTKRHRQTDQETVKHRASFIVIQIWLGSQVSGLEYVTTKLRRINWLIVYHNGIWRVHGKIRMRDWRAVPIMSNDALMLQIVASILINVHALNGLLDPVKLAEFTAPAKLDELTAPLTLTLAHTKRHPQTPSGRTKNLR
jgi:hypothetical protein